MKLNDLPVFAANPAAPTNDGSTAMAQLGSKLVDALIQQVAQSDTLSGKSSGGGGFREFLEYYKLIKTLEGKEPEPQTARDAGLAEVVKLVQTMSERMMDMVLEMRKDPPRPKDNNTDDDFIRELGKQMVMASLQKDDPKEKFREDLKSFLELQQELKQMSPTPQGLTFEQQLALEDRRLELLKVQNEFNAKLEAMRKDQSLYENGLSAAKALLESRREQMRTEADRTELGRTAVQTDAPPTPILRRMRCQACGFEMAVLRPEDVRICPKCGNRRTDLPDSESPDAPDHESEEGMDA